VAEDVVPNVAGAAISSFDRCSKDLNSLAISYFPNGILEGNGLRIRFDRDGAQFSAHASRIDASARNTTRIRMSFTRWREKALYKALKPLPRSLENDRFAPEK
jgi:hypothetical protein